MAPSTLHAPGPPWLMRVRFVLVGTSHPGNVGATARAMRVMGLRELVLVAPRSERIARHPEAVARASGALDVLENSRVVETLAQALESCNLAVAVSADTREFGPPPQSPEEIAALAFDEASTDPAANVAFVFGAERNGLSIESVGLCHRVCSIPGNTGYASLNLAQAVQIVAYCLRAHERLRAPPVTPASEARFAAHAQIEALYAHLERALVRVGFLDPRHPKKLMPRLRRLFSRTRLEIEEVELLRGVCTQIEKSCVNPYAASDPQSAHSSAASTRAESE
ncbi:MAG: RNA methyltransferase [Burkholderiaceae bacterium]|nr:RNA methyltransferase [Burkholderiaceae bacterium]